ncbi:MAG: hypothetical protein Q4F97_09965 [Bacteroidales bacterium]|nr:hypothetical protein [Bacteroidales bacterium]
METPEINTPKKDYFEPSHTVEHILNQTMIRMFGCERSKNAHIERKKSKADYVLEKNISDNDILEIEKRVNEVINRNLDVNIDYRKREDVKGLLDLSKLPEDASDTLRIVTIGDYDICPCIGKHVENTSQIGRFKIISYDFNSPILRLRFKIER